MDIWMETLVIQSTNQEINHTNKLIYIGANISQANRKHNDGRLVRVFSVCDQSINQS